MEIENQIQLRPRFEKIVAKSVPAILDKIQKISPDLKPDIYINTLDDHIWISIGKEFKKVYTPQLHLELEDLQNGETKIKGVYSPDPGLWTMFMFLHFVIAGIFIIFGVIAYSNWSLNQPFRIHLAVIILLIIAWFSLYFTARANRKKGMPQARKLEKVMEDIFENAG